MELRENSKTRFNSSTPSSLETINAGSLQRVADATELMARNFLQLQDEAARQKRWREDAENQLERLRRRLTAAKGRITTLKNKVAELKAEQCQPQN